MIRITWLFWYKNTMKCPSCGHEQEATDKCASCGIYFAKWNTQGAASKPRPDGKSPAEAGQPRIGIGAIGITALFTALLVIGFMRKGKEPAAAAVPQVVADRKAAPVDAPQEEEEEADQGESDAATVDEPPQKSAPEAAEKPLEAARNATVLIETGMGLGSGFIIDGQCHVITNRHVVDMNGKRMAAEVLRDPKARAAISRARGELEEQIQMAEERLHDIRSARAPATNLEEATLEHRIAEARKRLEDPTLGLKDYVANEASKAERAGFTATLPDGSRYESLSAKVADDVDLAVFKLPAKFCTPIKLGSSKDLAYGQRLYTIGNPSGMTYTLTSGVFSGERLDGERRYLQTDAPINPGNSGGPLLTEDGRVIGINSMVLKDTQGIGFALPIEAVFEAFPELAQD